MSVAFAVFTSDPNLLPCELFRLRDQISLTDGPATAVGCGTFAQEEVLLQRYPSGVLSPGSLFEAWDGIHSEALLYHASLLPPGTSLEEDTQPFRYHRWMFCHNGSIRDFPSIRSRLLSLIPEHLQRLLHGDTDSEACFALFLKLLRDSNRTDDIQLEAALAAQLLWKTVRIVEQLSSEAGDSLIATLNFIATNGRMLVATRRGGEKLFYRLLEGSSRCQRCGIEPSFPDARPRVRSHRSRKSIAIASHLRDSTGWFEIQDGSALAVGSDLNIQHLPI